MRTIFSIVALIIVVTLSCNGRHTKKEALELAISEFKLRTSSIDLVTYYPESYVEIVTDTLISRSINVHIKNYSLLDEQILISNATEKTSKTTSYQRVFESEISISTNSKDILKTRISAKQFRMFHVDSFWENATLQHAWVNQELSTANSIKLDISFVNPKNNSYKLYRMSIDSFGQQTLKLIEEYI